MLAVKKKSMANHGLAVVILGADQKRTLRKIKGKVFEVSSFKFQRNVVLINVIFHVVFLLAGQ